MAKWEYRTIFYARAHRGWFITPFSAEEQARPVGESSKGWLSGGVREGLHLLETALKELDAEGWELVSTSFFGVDGTAVLRRPISTDQKS